MRRGNAVVVVNETDKPREGTNVDKDNLMSIINILGFQCINVKDSLNVSSKRWQHEGNRKEDCDCLSCRIKTSALVNDGTDCFLFAITTHGGEKEGSMKLKFSDKKLVDLKSIVDVLNSDCLRGKKKILIVQACRYWGNAASAGDSGVSISIAKKLEEVQIDPERTPVINDENPEDENTENQGEIDLGLSDGILPSFLPADFIVIYACWSGRIAHFSKKEGSWLVTDLKKQIDNHFEENTSLGFLQILTKTVASVAERESVFYKKTEDKKIELGTDGKPVKDPEQSGMKGTVTVVHTLTEPLTFQKTAPVEDGDEEPNPNL